MLTPYRFPYHRSSQIHSNFFYQFKNLALLKIGLSIDGRVTKPMAFIDTGAQFCLFDYTYAQYLGIEDFKSVDKKYIVPISGIGGRHETNRAYFHKVDLLVYKDQKHLRRENAIIVHQVEVGFLERPFEIGGILGVYGFLDRFSFLADISKSYFEIAPVFEVVS